MNHIEFTRQSPDKLQFYFQGWEPETSPRAVVCLVHGLGEHTGRYAHVAAALNDAGYAVLGFDLRGHGKSEGLRGHTPSYETLMDDIGRLLDEAAQRYPGKAQFIYGHSLGGNLVLNYALETQTATRRGRLHQPGHPCGETVARHTVDPGQGDEQATAHHADAERPGAR